MDENYSPHTDTEPNKMDEIKDQVIMTLFIYTKKGKWWIANYVQWRRFERNQNKYSHKKEKIN